MKNSISNLKTKVYKENYQLANECVGEGVKLLREGKLKNAEAMVRRGKDIFEEIGELRKKSSALNVLSIILDEMGNDAMSMECLLEAIDDSLEIEAFDMASKVYNNLGSKFMYLKSYERALDYFKKALDMFEKAVENNQASDIDIQAFALVLNLNISTTYCYMGNNEKAREYYAIAKEKSTHPYCEKVLFTFQCFEGMVLWKTGDEKQAAELIDTIIEGARNCEYTTDYLETFSELLELLKAMKEYDKWKEVLELIESRMKDEMSLYDKMGLIELWLDYYKATNNSEEYVKISSKYYELYQEKEFHEYEKRAEMLESMTEMRRSRKQKEQTDKIVFLDPLTQIGNRNRLLRDSDEFIRTSATNKTSISIGLVDVDYFKECNDTYGHIVGDECLKSVAKVLTEAVGERGNVYRYGGDEFLILMPAISEEEVLVVGKAIKDKFDELNIPNINSPVVPHVSVSQGYTQVYASINDTIEKLINSADSVLYSVKRGGRNNYKFTRYIEIASNYDH